MRHRSESPWDNPDLRESVRPMSRPHVGQGASETNIGRGSFIQGNIKLQGRSQINGEVEGEINAKGELIIGEEAVIKANISGELVLIFGKVEGHIKCTERIEMHAGAQVTGDVLSPKIVIQDGVVFEGRCWMGERDSDSRSSN